MGIAQNKIYKACNKFQWFTGGTNEQYEKLFSKVDEGASLKDIALMIWLCTPDTSEKEILENLEQYCSQ